jgi:hypothetical protein
MVYGLNATCIDVYNKANININDKTALKAIASMGKGVGLFSDGYKDIDACIIPEEVHNIFGSLPLAGKCQLINKSVIDDSVQNINILNETKSGIFSWNETERENQINSGINVYPLRGCIYPMGDEKDAKKIVSDMGNILQYDNEKILHQLRTTLQKLIDDCAVLDDQISTETTKLFNIRQQLAQQRALCQSYTTDIPHYKNLIAALRISIAQKNADADRIRRNREQAERDGNARAEADRAAAEAAAAAKARAEAEAAAAAARARAEAEARARADAAAAAALAAARAAEAARYASQYVVVYEHGSYEGASMTIRSNQRGQSVRIPFATSSIKVFNGGRGRLNDARGATKTFDSSTGWVGNDWNDRAVSATLL